jgi:3-oxoacyl-[acyl-carrier-protein] synthase II
MKAIQKLFGGNKNMTISATKSSIGHLLGGAGAAEAIICIMAVHEDVVPPTINTAAIDEKLPKGMDILIGASKKRTVNVALSNTFGFGGHNASLVVRKL